MIKFKLIIFNLFFIIFTSSAVFHFASCPRRFWPAQTDVWLIINNKNKIKYLYFIIYLHNLQIQLPISRIENENGSVNRLSGQISFKGFMNCDSVNISIVDEPDNLVTKELLIILWVQVRFGLNKYISTNLL